MLQRRFRYSLRAIIAAITLTCIVLAWFVHERSWYYQDRRTGYRLSRHYIISLGNSGVNLNSYSPDEAEQLLLPDGDRELTEFPTSAKLRNGELFVPLDRVGVSFEPSFDDEAWQMLRQLRHVRSLRLCELGIQAQGPTFARFPELEELEIADTPLTDERLQEIFALPYLKVLGLSNVGERPLHGLSESEGLASLKELRLNSMSIPAEDLRRIFQRTGLTSLDIRMCDLPSASLQDLARLENLRFLYLSECAVQDESMKQIAKLSQLETLCLDGTSATNDTLRHVAHLKKLKGLALCNAPIDDEGINYIKGLELEWLNLHGTNVTEKSIDSLEEMPSLNWTTVLLPEELMNHPRIISLRK